MSLEDEIQDGPREWSLLEVIPTAGALVTLQRSRQGKPTLYDSNRGADQIYKVLLPVAHCLIPITVAAFFTGTTSSLIYPMF